MTDFIEWHPKHHGHAPLHWQPDMPASLDGKNFVHQQAWAWIHGTVYHVPYEAVYDQPRPVDAREQAESEIVEWLRDFAKSPALGAIESYRVLFIADAIENGEHRREQGND